MLASAAVRRIPFPVNRYDLAMVPGEENQTLNSLDH